MQCNICQSKSSSLARALLLNKYDVQYYSCDSCGFIQTELPYWLEDAYSSAIARSDIGLIGRNIKLATFCSALIPMFYDSTSSFLDYGGGNGMFVRMMRDKGFDFYWQDKYVSNQFAVDFEGSKDMKYSLLTAFEVLEHLPNPLDIIEEMFKCSSTLIVTTRLLPYWRIQPDDWWYFTPDTGQHISLYSKESLAYIARKFSVNFSSNGVSLHVFSQKSIPTVLLKALSFHPFALSISSLMNVKRKSLLGEDYFRLTGKRLGR